MYNKRKGFTLVELVVVITIIGILLVIVVPKIQVYRIQAKITNNLAVARLVCIALETVPDKFKDEIDTCTIHQANYSGKLGYYLAYTADKVEQQYGTPHHITSDYIRSTLQCSSSSMPQAIFYPYWEYGYMGGSGGGAWYTDQVEAHGVSSPQALDMVQRSYHEFNTLARNMSLATNLGMEPYRVMTEGIIADRYGNPHFYVGYPTMTSAGTYNGEFTTFVDSAYVGSLTQAQIAANVGLVW